MSGNIFLGLEFSLAVGVSDAVDVCQSTSSAILTNTIPDMHRERKKEQV
jgi:glycerol-3-phosphate dehydrogenase